MNIYILCIQTQVLLQMGNTYIITLLSSASTLNLKYVFLYAMVYRENQELENVLKFKNNHKYYIILIHNKFNFENIRINIHISNVLYCNDRNIQFPTK